MEWGHCPDGDALLAEERWCTQDCAEKHPAPPVIDEQTVVAIHLSTCLASCRIEWQEEFLIQLAKEPPGTPRTEACSVARPPRREMPRWVPGPVWRRASVTACKRRLAERECVFGAGLRCAWFVAETNWSLPCCRRDQEANEDLVDADGSTATACPKSDVCP